MGLGKCDLKWRYWVTSNGFHEGEEMACASGAFGGAEVVCADVIVTIIIRGIGKTIRALRDSANFVQTCIGLLSIERCERLLDTGGGIRIEARFLTLKIW